MARIFRLKRIKVDEISLVDRPAYRESEIFFLKSKGVIATLDGLKLTGKPKHEFLDIEKVNEGTDKIDLLVTSIILSPGDKKKDGSVWTAEQIMDIELVWSRKVGKLETPNPWRLLNNSDGSMNMDCGLVAWGVTGDKPMMIMHCDQPVPPNAWFTQYVIGEPTSKKLISDKRSLNGIDVQGAAISSIGKTDSAKVDGDEELDIALEAIIEYMDENNLSLPEGRLGEIVGEIAAKSVGPADVPDGFTVDEQIELVDAKAFVTEVGRRIAAEAEELVEVDTEKMMQEVVAEVVAELSGDEVIEVDTDQLAEEARREVMQEVADGR